ncbi:hypothetical protein SODALDRAFT_392215 [Sodiomyces alkalinus F11]|uniref:C2H2-type domain-containing protein n=1 Tax=Sodiomyces alkalinus (strain CBS 110278 / VKM F-3762 / F11) TaxID=1314773 RepID=A0A3N2Q7P2_SODAK|nr:hypothetical protein SODALDRAFT_392215 [Sodiomyces alkalinus F11]ROT42803.1 hypothetical protein SODALDRAFT_392215 [Sodiomyces alkalinus F11]
MFSFSHTGPSSDHLSGSSWDNTEAAQNFQQEFLDTGSSHPGDGEEFAFHLDGHITPRGQLPSTMSSVPLGGEPMKRGSSRTSTGSHKHRITKPSKSRGTLTMTSQMSSQLSALDMTGNASVFKDSQTTSHVDGMNPCLFLDTSSSGVSSQMLYSELPMGLGMDSNGLPSASDMAMHVVPAHMQLDPDASLTSHSPSASWTSFSPPESHLASPTGSPEETWLPEPLMASTPRSQHGSPSLQASQNDTKLSAQDLIGTDLSGSVMTMVGEEYSLPPSYTARRPTNEGESARDHPLYKNAAPGPDGLFHCPWEGQASCNHKAEKLKCNYDKFVDSHLKPYRCKDPACENSRFSSTACLLRHEREAHAMHGHGDKPFLCTYEGCDRAIPGNGFPRQWNLRDHMRRVHNDNRLPGSPTAPAQNQQQSKGRKRKEAPKSAAAAASRKAAAKVSAIEAAAREAQAQRPLIEEWTSHQKALENIIRSLNQPEDGRNAQLIKQAQGHLSAMGKLSINLSPAQQQQQQVQMSLHRTYSSTG